MKRRPSMLQAYSEGVLAAVQAASQQGMRYREAGMSAASFATGIMLVFLTAFVLGRWPEHFWLFSTLKCAALLVAVWPARRRNGTALYWLDFCWVATFAKTLIGFCVGAAAWLLAPAPAAWVFALFDRREVMWALFGLAGGPLGWQVLLQNNALVLHDAQVAASTFIHLSPPFTAWALRWHPAAHRAAYPGMFIKGLPNIPQQGHSAGLLGRVVGGIQKVQNTLAGGAKADLPLSLWQFYAPPAVAYMLWWIPYTAWLLWKGRFIGRTLTADKRDTIYHLSMRQHPKLAKSLCGFGEAPAALAPALKYMLWHLGVSAVLLVPTPLLWESYCLHTTFCVCLLASSALAGGARCVRCVSAKLTKYDSVADADRDP